MASGDEHGFFWNSVNGDRKYDATSFELWLKKFFTSGVFDGELGVSANGGMSIAVAGGYANLDGKAGFFERTTFTLANANSTYPRIDTVVVRRDNANRTITLNVVTGQYSGTSPQATPPTRTSSIYELVLAEVYVGAGATGVTAENITDKRRDSSVCGIVAGTVEEIDTTDIFAQYQAAWDFWFNNVKDELSQDAAGHLQDEIDAVNEALEHVQETLTFDDVPTSGSSNPVRSSGIYNSIADVESDVTNLSGSFTAFSNRFSMGTTNPSGGNNGDIYFQYS